jgi:hypothetical protein
LGSFVQQGDKTREKGDNHESYFLCLVVFSFPQPSPRTSDSTNLRLCLDDLLLDTEEKNVLQLARASI